MSQNSTRVLRTLSQMGQYDYSYGHTFREEFSNELQQSKKKEAIRKRVSLSLTGQDVSHVICQICKQTAQVFIGDCNGGSSDCQGQREGPCRAGEDFKEVRRKVGAG